MKRSFKERAIIRSSSIIKQHKYLKPLVLFLYGVVMSFYNIAQYFINNGKRYITIGLTLVFFFMSSSFSKVDTSDTEIYLTESINADSGFDVTEVTATNEVISVEDIEDTDDIISSELILSEFDRDLESTENIDTFTLDDFIEKQNSINTSTNESELSGFDKDAWYLILVNKTHPVPDDYEMELTEFSGSMKCDVRVLDILLSMLDGAKKDGVNLIVCSPYRDYALQERLFNKKVNLYVSYGYSYMDAYKLASTKVIVPGASEHQLGLAFDIVTDYHAVLDYEFGDTEAGIWLKNHCSEYGFILRYPRGKEELTGIEFEPWHFRYVGVDAAKYIMENDITLEEFIEGL